MATISNIINTIFSSQGSDRVEADYHRLARAQTRLGNASAGAGRQFASQSAGMGGLVAAYAGAAATTFALSAAFEALASSARAIQTIQGTDVLAAGIAQSGKAVIASMKEITNGQLSMAAAAEQANLGFSAGFNTAQLEALTNVSMKASRALGRDLTDSMTRVVRGSAKMEAELLDELGIYARIDPATRAYAAIIGKTASELTEFERRQAFVNAVIAEGTTKFNAINTTIPTSAEKLEALRATFADMATSFGAFLADAIAPIAGGILNNTAAAFAAMGIVMSMVAGKGVSVLKESIKQYVTNMNEALRANENKMRALLKITDATIAATRANSEYNASNLKLSETQKASFNKLQDTAKTRELTRKELIQSTKLLKANGAALQTEKDRLNANTASYAAAVAEKRALYSQAKADALQATAKVAAERSVVVTGGIGTPEARAKASAVRAARAAERTALAEAANARNAVSATLAAQKPLMQANNAALAQNTTEITANTAAINANAAATNGWRARLAALGTSLATPFIAAAANIGRTIGLLTGLASKVFFWVSIFQLLGTTIANAFGKADEYNAWFSELGKSITTLLSGEKTKSKKNVILGAVGGTLSDLESLDQRLKDTDSFKFKKKSIFGIEIQVEKTKEQLVSEVSSMMSKAGEEGNKSFWESFASGSALAGAGIGAMVGGPIGAAVGLAIGAAVDYAMTDTVDSLVAKYGDNIRSKFANELSKLPEDVRETAVRALVQIEDSLGNKALFDPAARSAKNLQEQLVFGSVEATRTISAIDQVGAALAKSSGEVRKAFDFNTVSDGIQGIASDVTYVSEAITNVQGISMRFLFVDDMNEQLKDLVDTTFYTVDKLKGISVGNVRLLDVSNLFSTEDDTALQKVIDSYKQKIEAGIKAGLSDGELYTQLFANFTKQEQDLFAITVGLVGITDTLSSSFYNVAGGINTVQTSSLQAAQVLKDTFDGISKGTMTLETFSKNTSNVKDALILASREVLTISDSLNTLRQNVAMTAKSGSQDEYNQAVKLLDAEEQRLRVVQETLNTNMYLYGELKKQESVLKEQLSTLDFMKEQAKGLRSNVGFDFELAISGAQNAKKAINDFYNSKISMYKADADTAKKYRDSILAINEQYPMMLQESQLQALVAGSTADMDKLQQAIKGVEGASIDTTNKIVTLAGTPIPLVEQSSQTALNIVQTTSEAQKKLAQDTVLELISMAKKFGETLASMNSDIAVARLELANNIKLSDIQIKIDMLDVKMQAVKAASEFNIAFKQNQIKLIELKVDNKEIKPVEGAKQVNTLESQILAEKYMLIDREKAIAEETYVQRWQMIQEEGMQAKEKIRMEAEAKQAQIEAEYQLLQDQMTAAVETYGSISQMLATALTDGGNNIGHAVVNAFNAGAQTILAALGSTLAAALGASYAPAQFTDQVAKTNYAESAIAALKTSVADLGKSAETTKTNIGKLADDQIAQADKVTKAKTKQLDAEWSAQLTDFNNRKILAGQERQIADEEAKKRLKDAAGGGKEELSPLEKKLKAIFDAIKGNIENTLMSLNNLIFYGEGNFKDIASNFFKTLQQDIFKVTIAEPLSNKLTESIFGMLGVNTMLGADNATVRFTAEGRALLVTIAGGANGLFPNVSDGTSKNNKDATASGIGGLMSETTNIFSGFFDKFTGFFKNLFGEGGILSNLLSGLFGQNGILSGLFKGILGFFGLGIAQGGVVHMAQGGAAVSSALTRDRVPAMLEPGEFVLRKQAARKIGVPALQAMNATGSTPGIGNVAVNVTNEGSPKDAEASKPRFDGEKYVIDVVMRDISNNGPIRRSLRGRGGL